MNLKNLRKSVDSIDSVILKLLNKRAKVILDIAKVKGKVRGSIYVPDREKEVYRNVATKNSGPMSDGALRAIYREIMSGALELERPLRIAYFGPQFTNTHIASMKKFGSSVRYTACGTIRDVFSEVEKGRADYGVVPIENSIEGAVNYTLDMFMDSDLKICSEVYMEISHNLLSKDSSRAKIKSIYSNPQVFGQCRVWLETNLPAAELVEVSSTSKAAEIVSHQKGAACIASILAAKHYGLKVLEDSIQDSSHNVTRFLIIGKTEARVTKEDKTSVMFSVKDRSGALHDVLVPFKKYGINMTKIESRPSKIKAWEYYFFVDIEGHHKNARVAKALSELKKGSAYLKVLGSYPTGGRI
ncbi:MAG: prephenate dehydratase [Candidatus Omnitrophica bacterium]|nr:prephenate dehydratase [Candidatus Omnitrophota bacterium]